MSPVFVVGPPRSGTTWVLKLLSEHPDVVAATASNLGLPDRGLSMETGIFQTGLNDGQIKERFLDLAKNNPGKTIVEKTPLHLLHVDRITKVFPKAKLVLVMRGGKDTVASILAVGRNKSSWWKDAPWKTNVACRLWMKYYAASAKCAVEHEPVTVKYEELHANPVDVTTRLMHALSLDASHASESVRRCVGGKNIPIDGVFRKGKVGGWRDVMTKEDERVFEEICR